jgi:hypothetical protein
MTIQTTVDSCQLSKTAYPQLTWASHTTSSALVDARWYSLHTRQPFSEIRLASQMLTAYSRHCQQKRCCRFRSRCRSYWRCCSTSDSITRSQIGLLSLVPKIQLCLTPNSAFGLFRSVRIDSQNSVVSRQVSQ